MTLRGPRRRRSLRSRPPCRCATPPPTTAAQLPPPPPPVNPPPQGPIHALCIPTAVDDYYTTARGVPLDVTSGAGLGVNDVPCPDTTYTIVGATDPSHGSVVFTPNEYGLFEYRPHPQAPDLTFHLRRSRSRATTWARPRGHHRHRRLLGARLRRLLRSTSTHCCPRSPRNSSPTTSPSASRTRRRSPRARRRFGYDGGGAFSCPIPRWGYDSFPY